MGKDEIKPCEFCPDCVNDESNTEPGANETDECCSCCCSCSDSDSENGNTREPSTASRLLLSVEQQKKDLLSNLTILQTNREPTSIQHVLQFIEALTHSDNFLRRYNLQEDFCLQCLISEPTCTCCTNGISQLRINDNPSCSCDECDSTDESRYQRCSSQECTECLASSKPPVSGKQTSVGRRDRRRRRRRQRNVRHNLPRVSTQSFIQTNRPPNQTQNANSTDTSCSQCKRNGKNSSNSEETLTDCPDCKENETNVPESKGHHAVSHHDSCEECEREEASKYKVRYTSKKLPNSYHVNAHCDSNFCEECVPGNQPSSSSCSFSSYRNPGTRRQRRRNVSRTDSRERENAPEPFCTCCSSSSSSGQRGISSQTDQSKRMKTSEKPECDQQDALASSSESGKNQPTECSCEDCQTNSECSEESCEECETHHTTKWKNGKKK